MTLGKAKKICCAIGAAGAAALLIWAGREAAESAANAVTLCLTVMIPSLYAFTVLSKLIIASGIYRLLSRPFSFISRYVFRLPAEFFSIFLISQLAGYPIGAALLSGLCEEGRLSEREAEKMLCFCIAPGPAYIMAVSSVIAPSSPKIWISVFIAVIGANALFALAGTPLRSVPPADTNKDEISLNARSFTAAVKSGAESMTMICAMIIFMSAIMGIASKAGILGAAARFIAGLTGIQAAQVYPFVKSFFEISNLTSAFGSAYEVLPVCAALLSFGGICVHMQIASVCGGINPLPAALSRIPCAAAAYLICKRLLPKFYTFTVVAVNAPVHDDIKVMLGNNSPILSIILLIMTILIISQKSIVKNKKI